MYRSLLLAAALALPSLFVSANPSQQQDACPLGSFLEPVPHRVEVEVEKQEGRRVVYEKESVVEYTCECVTIHSQTKSFTKDCSATLDYERNIPRCTAYCKPPPAPPRKPEPSKAPGRHGKRSIEQLSIFPNGSPSHCDARDLACPIPSMSKTDLEYECVKPQEDIDNCGGCASTGDGVSCTELPGVRGTSCVKGSCEIYSCQRGYVLRTDIDGKRYCRKTYRSHANQTN